MQLLHKSPKSNLLGARPHELSPACVPRKDCRVIKTQASLARVCTIALPSSLPSKFVVTRDLNVRYQGRLQYLIVPRTAVWIWVNAERACKAKNDVTVQVYFWLRFGSRWVRPRGRSRAPMARRQHLRISSAAAVAFWQRSLPTTLRKKATG